ncbi:MAG TPA: hypothetical protein VG245_05735 [Candidatus Dormibacteraeota bacterium]|jgi:hypothetical protein|nr:hypothetical protein [Candidatus Dormibacteraeota bacterium]
MAGAYDGVVARLVADDGAVAGKMFGMDCVKAGGKAFAGNFGEDMVFKLSGEAHARALALAGAHLFDPMGGRPMKEWVVVPAAQAEAWLELARAAMEYVTG